jgi:hypothetical protein
LFCFCKVHIRCASSRGIGWGSFVFMLHFDRQSPRRQPLVLD